MDTIACGIRNTPLTDRIGGGRTTGEFEYPWVVAIFVNGTDRFISSGSLIHSKVAITLAQKVDDYLNSNPQYRNTLYVRAGDYNLALTDESKQHQSRDIIKILIHPQYGRTSKFFNIALIVVQIPFTFEANIKPICLPPENMNFVGERCFTAGWGKNGSTKSSKYQTVLQVVDLPIVDTEQCEQRVNDYSKANNQSILVPKHSTILCAGGELNKDACKGDGGSPLFCPIDNSLNQFYQAGIVSTGIECGLPIPAFYTNVSSMKSWIDYTLIVTLKLDTDTYTYFGDHAEEDDTPVYQEQFPTTPKPRTIVKLF